MRHRCFVIGLVLIPIPRLLGQAPPRLEPGVLVRVSTAPEGARPNWIVGTAKAVTGDRLTLRPKLDDSRDIEIARVTIVRLEVSRGQKSKWLTGLGLGFVAGAAVGAVIGYQALHEGHDFAGRDAALVGAAPGALAGGLLGLAIGSRHHHEHWQAVPFPPHSVGGTPPWRSVTLFSLGFRSP